MSKYLLKIEAINMRKIISYLKLQKGANAVWIGYISIDLLVHKDMKNIIVE